MRRPYPTKLAVPGQPDNALPAINLLQRFLQAPAPAGEPKKWVPVSAYGGFEHAQWLDAASLERFLGEALISSYVGSADLQGKPSPEQVRLLLPQPARYVSMVRDDVRFKRLIDRHTLLEEVARNVLNESLPQKPNVDLNGPPSVGHLLNPVDILAEQRSAAVARRKEDSVPTPKPCQVGRSPHDGRLLWRLLSLTGS